MTSTSFKLEKWQPERLNPGGPFGARAHWRSIFIYNGGSDLNEILVARQNAIEQADKFGAGWRVVREETEVIHTNEPDTIKQ